MNIKRPERPSKPYSSFQIYLVKHRRPSDGKPICLRCNGSTKIYNPNEERCPVEGYKMVSRIKCPRCDGTGIGTVEECKNAYRETMDHYNAKVANYKHDLGLYQSIKSKLNQEELKFLGVQ